MRFTHKIDNYYRIIHNWDSRNTFEDQNKEEFAIQKLGQIEDIEEEFGVDLITLLKVVRNGCYAMIEDEYGNLQQPQFFPKTNINKCSIGVYTYIEYLRRYGYKYCSFKDYGKTWALTKEELQ